MFRPASLSRSRRQSIALRILRRRSIAALQRQSSRVARRSHHQCGSASLSATTAAAGNDESVAIQIDDDEQIINARKHPVQFGLYLFSFATN
jgi:hypothetical protein